MENIIEVPKKKRGRPVGSKNRSKGIESIDDISIPIDKEVKPPLVPIINDGGKSCADCKVFLKCHIVTKAHKAGTDIVVCDKFEDNFLSESEEAEENEDNVIPYLFICNGITNKCVGCVHAHPHDPLDYFHPISDEKSCHEKAEVCDEAGIEVQCVPVVDKRV